MTTRRFLIAFGLLLAKAGAQGITSAPYTGLFGAPGIPTSGLVAAWDLTTVSGQSVPGAWGKSPTLERGSGSGSDTNDPAITSTGLSFDGTDDYCRTSALTITSGAVTIIAVGNPAWQGLGGGRAIFSDSVSYGPTTGIHTALQQDAVLDWAAKSFIMFGAGYNSGRAPRTTGLFGSITSSTYHSIGGSLSTGVATSYLDGAAITSVAATGTVDSTSSRVFYLGREITGGYFAGTMSYLLVWDRALTANEHAQVHRWLRRYLGPKGILLP